MARRARSTTGEPNATRGPGRAGSSGRATPKGGGPKGGGPKGGGPKGGEAKGSRAGNRRPGRYTAPIPREVRHSPAWYPWVLLSVLVVGVVLIILNYVNALPSSPTNWYTIGGLGAILVGAAMATRYR